MAFHKKHSVCTKIRLFKIQNQKHLPPPHVTPPRRLRHLDPRAFGARTRHSQRSFFLFLHCTVHLNYTVCDCSILWLAAFLLLVCVCIMCCMAQSKPVQSPRVLPPLPSSSDNPDVSRVHSRTPSSSKSSSESGVVSMSASNSTDDNLVPAASKPAAISKSSDGESLRVFFYFLMFFKLNISQIFLLWVF